MPSTFASEVNTLHPVLAVSVSDETQPKAGALQYTKRYCPPVPTKKAPLISDNAHYHLMGRYTNKTPWWILTGEYLSSLLQHEDLYLVLRPMSGKDNVASEGGNKPPYLPVPVGRLVHCCCFLWILEGVVYSCSTGRKTTVRRTKRTVIHQFLKVPPCFFLHCVFSTFFSMFIKMSSCKQASLLNSKQTAAIYRTTKQLCVHGLVGDICKNADTSN